MRALLVAASLALMTIAGCTSFQWVQPEAGPAVEVAPDVIPEPTLEVLLEATPSPTCLIKGNVSSSGERIFHVPGGASWGRTVVDPEHGEAWFCSASDAEAAGFRAALR